MLGGIFHFTFISAELLQMKIKCVLYGKVAQNKKVSEW